jgi:cobalt-zinc-cadmium efflux system outer membrane protein
MSKCPSSIWLKAIGISAFYVLFDSVMVCAAPSAIPAVRTNAGSSPTSPGLTAGGSLNSAPISSDLTSGSSSNRMLSLRASFDRAASYNKEAIAAKTNVDLARAGIKVAGALPNPRFNLQYGWGPAFEVIIAGNPQQFGFQHQIRTAGTRTKLINFARASYRVAELQYAATMFDIHNRTRRAYAELAAAEAFAELIESQRKVAAELLQTTQKRFDEKKVSQSDLFQAQLGVLQFETQRFQAQARLQAASANLATIVGEVPAAIEVIDVDDNGLFRLSAEQTDLVPSPDRTLPALSELLPVALTERPDLKVSVQQKFADRRALSVARSQRIPDVFVEMGYQFTTFKKTQPYNLFPGKVPNSPGCYINALFEVPLFYQHQGETSQAKEVYLQDQEQIEQLQFQVAADVVSAYEAVTVTRATIKKYQRDLLPEASKVARVARRNYEEGKSDLSQAILAKQQYQQMLSSYFDAVANYQIAWADLEKAMGVSLKL